MNVCALVALLVESRYLLPDYSDRHGPSSRPRLAGSFVSGLAAYALRLNSRAGTEGSTVSSLNCDRWLLLDLEVLSHAARASDNRWRTTACTGSRLMTTFARAAKLGSGPMA